MASLDQIKDVKSKNEIKVVMDSDSNIDSAFLTAEAKNGWRLIYIINSTQGRPNDRYYFERTLVD